MTKQQWDKKLEAPIEKIYWSVGEIGKMFGVKASLIRFWEVEFGRNLHTKRSKKGERQFMKEDIETIRTIHHLLKVELYTIKGARKRLKEGATL